MWIPKYLEISYMTYFHLYMYLLKGNGHDGFRKRFFFYRYLWFRCITKIFLIIGQQKEDRGDNEFAGTIDTKQLRFINKLKLKYTNILKFILDTYAIFQYNAFIYRYVYKHVHESLKFLYRVKINRTSAKTMAWALFKRKNCEDCILLVTQCSITQYDITN